MLYQRGNSLDYVHINNIPDCDSLKFQVRLSVTNSGDMDGSEVVLLYSTTPEVLKGSPQKQLIGFERLHISSNETMETSFIINPCEQLSIADENGNSVLALGDHILSSEHIKHVLSIRFQ